MYWSSVPTFETSVAWRSYLNFGSPALTDRFHGLECVCSVDLLRPRLVEFDFERCFRSIVWFFGRDWFPGPAASSDRWLGSSSLASTPHDSALLTFLLALLSMLTELFVASRWFPPPPPMLFVE